MLWFKYVLHRIKVWYLSRFAIDKFEIAACPSCGLIGPKKVRFMRAYEAPVLTCPRDGAQWGMPPLVPYERWKIKGIEEVELEMQAKADEAAADQEKELFKR